VWPWRESADELYVQNKHSLLKVLDGLGAARNLKVFKVRINLDH
jgi:hypothetical protein